MNGYRRKGLYYEPLHEDDDMVRFSADRPFVVDGIRYHIGTANYCIRLMFDLIDDYMPFTVTATRMRTGQPPTETELDEYVTTGLIDGVDAGRPPL